MKINHFHVIDNVETMIEALRIGMGLGIVPRDLISATELQKEFHHVQFKSDLLFNELFLVQEANYIPNVLCKKFLEFLESEIKY